MDYNEFINNQVNSGGSKLARQLTLSFRDYALGRGWPLGIVLFIQIKFLNVGDDRTRGPFGGAIFDVSYPDIVKKKVEDLEYGTQDTPPNPAIRSFLNRVDDRNEVFEDSLSETMMHILDFEELL